MTGQLSQMNRISLTTNSLSCRQFWSLDLFLVSHLQSLSFLLELLLSSLLGLFSLLQLSLCLTGWRHTVLIQDRRPVLFISFPLSSTLSSRQHSLRNHSTLCLQNRLLYRWFSLTVKTILISIVSKWCRNEPSHILSPLLLLLFLCSLLQKTETLHLLQLQMQLGNLLWDVLTAERASDILNQKKYSVCQFVCTTHQSFLRLVSLVFSWTHTHTK